MFSVFTPYRFIVLEGENEIEKWLEKSNFKNAIKPYKIVL